MSIGPFHDPMTWYGINNAVAHVTQWYSQDKGKSGWSGTSSFVLEVPCDRIVQWAIKAETNDATNRYDTSPRRVAATNRLV